jgi:outer membrane protein TolC
MPVTYRNSPALILTCSSILSLVLGPCLLARNHDQPTSSKAKAKISAKTTPAVPSAVPKAKLAEPNAQAGSVVPMAKPPRPDKLTAEEEPSPIPATGPLNLQQLIDAALYNNMDVIKARGKIEIAKMKRLATTDWKNPELRLGYSSQVDVEVGDPYRERSTSYTLTDGTEVDQQFYGGSSSVNGGVSKSQSRYEFESGRFRETRYRTVEREVTPGATVDKVVTREYETRNSSGTSRRTRIDNGSDKFGAPEREVSSENGRNNNRQKLTSQTTTYIHHRDTTTPERQFGMALRFPFPNLWEIKPRIDAAEAEIRAADYDSLAVENEIIAKVRAVYEELSYYEALAKSSNILADKRKELADYSKTNALDKLAKAAGSTSSAKADAFRAKFKADALRRELANLTGINDYRRISIPPNFRHRVIDLSKLNQEYLLQMASVFRMDLRTLHAKNESARAEYKKERAARFPFLGYFQAGYAVQSDRGGRDSNEWSIGLGISLPLWSNTINDAEKVPQAEARALSRQIGRLQSNIEADITSALQSLREAQAMIDASEKHFAALEILMKNEARGGAGFSKNPLEVVNESEEMVLEMNLRRLEMHRLYNETVQNLERALGTRLEKILQPQK